jgi:hypothetical protein
VKEGEVVEVHIVLRISNREIEIVTTSLAEAEDYLNTTDGIGEQVYEVQTWEI